jgi:imidazolonepropionase-like amidohydrolase
MIKHIFLIATVVVVIGLSALLFTLPTTDENQQSSANDEAATSSNNVLFSNVSVFTGTDLIENQYVLVKDGLVTAISDSSIDVTNDDNVQVVDGQGKTLLPGLLDSHTHSYGSGLNDGLRFGVTAHFDMFSMESTLAATRAKRDSLQATNESDLYSSGTMATVEGGHGTQFGFSIDTVDSVDEIESWVSLRKQAGADYIKLVYIPNQSRIPSLSRAWAQEVINQAHKQGLKALAHISTHQAAQDMIEDGINGLVHIFADKLASDELIDLALQNNVFIIPTLAVIASVDSTGYAQALATREGIEARLSSQQKSTLLASFGADIPGFEFALAKQNVKRFYDAGVTILAGSDSPNSGTAFGISLHHEVMLLAEAGLSNQQAISAATIVPADIFDVERGEVKVGSRADLVLIDGNPFAELDVLLNVDSVFKNGYQVDTSLASQSSKNEKLDDISLSNFDTQGLATLNGFTWAKSDDSMANGQSSARIELALDRQKQSTVLVVNAKVDATFAYPWAGAAVGDFMPPVQGFDINANSELMIDIKGTPGTYRIMAFDANAAGIPPTQTIEVNEQWQTITVALDDFAGFDPAAFSGFAIVAGPTVGEYEFSLDKVNLK